MPTEQPPRFIEGQPQFLFQYRDVEGYDNMDVYLPSTAAMRRSKRP